MGSEILKFMVMRTGLEISDSQSELEPMGLKDDFNWEKNWKRRL